MNPNSSIMKKLLVFTCLLTNLLIAQDENKIVTYNYGKNGLELIVKQDDGTTILISTYNSRPDIKDEIALNVLEYFEEKKPSSGSKIKIEATTAVVDGTIKIVIKDKLTAIDFYYESVNWFKKRITEVYVDPQSIK